MPGGRPKPSGQGQLEGPSLAQVVLHDIAPEVPPEVTAGAKDEATAGSKDEVTDVDDEDGEVGCTVPSRAVRPPETQVPKANLQHRHLASRSGSRACAGTAQRVALGSAFPGNMPARSAAFWHQTRARATGINVQPPHQRPPQPSPSVEPVVRRAPPKPKRTLQLTDSEILEIYRSAQTEAAFEADWLGIQGPKPCIGPSSSLGEGDRGGGPDARSPTSCASAGSGQSCSNSTLHGSRAEESSELDDIKQECLRILSRALQQPGRPPGSLAAEITSPRSKLPDVEACCTSPPKEWLGATSPATSGLYPC